jgi:hypothetical protein
MIRQVAISARRSPRGRRRGWLGAGVPRMVAHDPLEWGVDQHSCRWISTGAYYYRLAERPRTKRSSHSARWSTDTARTTPPSATATSTGTPRQRSRRPGFSTATTAHHVSHDVLYSLEPGPWLTTTEPPGRGGGRARGGRSGGVGRGGGNAVSTELGRGSFSLHERAGRQGMGSWQADQTMAVGTGAIGARLVIGLLISGLIANSQARRDARALDQSAHRWAAEAVRWCAANSPAAAHRSSALGGSATCSVVVRSRVSARPCGSRCRVPPARRDGGHRPASNISRFCGPGRS